MKQFRITLHIMGKEVPGSWRDFDESELLTACRAFALNECAFTVEFQDV